MFRHITTAGVMILCCVFTAWGQTLSGRVAAAGADGSPVPLAGASVHYSGTATGTMTDAAGNFTLPAAPTDGWVVASFLGYRADSVATADIGGRRVEFMLEADAVAADAVVVHSDQSGTSFSRITAQKVERITSAGLMKMACCTLAESFENSATVTVGFTDAVSGAKQVQLLGLAGIYSQMMAENIPTMRGLASTYGWSYTPGQWLESIQISKGASSVVNGYESISGQMNLEFKKPDNTEDLFLNLYGDDGERFEANATAAVKVTDKLWTGLLVNGAIEDKAHDDNGDGFLDMPRMKLANIYNRWFYVDPARRVESRTGLRFLYEKRVGGEHDRPATRPLYRTDIRNRNFTAENKTGVSIGGKDGQSIGIITSFTHHEQQSSFGRKYFGGTQNSVYANVLFNSWIGSTEHSYSAGVGFAYDGYNIAFEDASDLTPTPRTRLDRDEAIPGAFAQYTWAPSERLSLIAGARGDWNSEYGWLFTPRANVRYAPVPQIVARASAGRGYRSPNVLSDNIGLLASSRRINVDGIQELGIEKAWNFGGNLSFYIPVWSGREMVISLDYFHTRFTNQAVVDTERDPAQVFYYDLRGSSYADVWQADLSLTVFEGFDLFAAFRYNDTRITLSDGARRYRVGKPLSSRYRGLVNLQYATRFKKWVFDATMQVNGPARLPSSTGYGAPAEHSPVYYMWFAQVTKNTKRLDIYAGVENLFDYKQKNPIIGAADPFAAGFDSSQIWGPLTGRRFYVGIRLRIGNF